MSEVFHQTGSFYYESFNCVCLDSSKTAIISCVSVEELLYRVCCLILTVVTPGPIDNEQLKEASPSVTSLSQLVPSTDYVQVSSTLWQFLYDIYGGGPAVELQRVATDPSPVS